MTSNQVLENLEIGSVVVYTPASGKRKWAAKVVRVKRSDFLGVRVIVRIEADGIIQTCNPNEIDLTS